MRRRMDVVSINIAPMRGNRSLDGATVFLYQSGRKPLYMEEFLDICHRATCDDICLIEGFRCGLDKDLHFIMPRGNPCWTLEAYINFALWVNDQHSQWAKHRMTAALSSHTSQTSRSWTQSLAHRHPAPLRQRGLSPRRRRASTQCE